MRGRQAEIAATVHFAATHLLDNASGRTEADVFNAVQAWKARRNPPLDEHEVRVAVRQLNLRGWIRAAYSPDLLPNDEDS